MQNEGRGVLGAADADGCYNICNRVTSAGSEFEIKAAEPLWLHPFLLAKIIVLIYLSSLFVL